VMSAAAVLHTTLYDSFLLKALHVHISSLIIIIARGSQTSEDEEVDFFLNYIFRISKINLKKYIYLSILSSSFYLCLCCLCLSLEYL